METRSGSLSPPMLQRRSGRKRRETETRPWQLRRALEPVPGPLGPYVASFIQHHLSKYQTASTAYYYRRELEILANHFPNKGPADITRKDLIDFTVETGEGLAPRSRKRTVSVLRTFFHWLDVMEIIPKNPAAVLESPRVPRPQPRYLSRKQVRALLAVARDDHTMQVYIGLGVYAGLRRDSIHKLEWRDVDLDGRMLTLRHTKGDKSNFVPINDELHRLLTLQKRIMLTKGSDSPHVLSHLWRGEWRGYSLTRLHSRLKELVEAAGLPPDTSTHDLRRTFATTLHQENIEESVISRLLGHADISTTHNHYTFTNDAQKEDAIATLSY